MKLNLTWVQIILVILKVTNLVTWPWWVILLPLYIVTVFTLFIFGVLGFFWFKGEKINLTRNGRPWKTIQRGRPTINR